MRLYDDVEEKRETAQYMAYVRKMELFQAQYWGIHGALLLFQSGLAMVVVVFFSCVARWKAGEGATRDGSGNTYVPLFDFTSSISFFHLWVRCLTKCIF